MSCALRRCTFLAIKTSQSSKGKASTAKQPILSWLRLSVLTFWNVSLSGSSSEACEGMLVFQTMSATDISLVIDHRVREIYRKRGSKKSGLPDTAREFVMKGNDKMKGLN